MHSYVKNALISSDSFSYFNENGVLEVIKKTENDILKYEMTKNLEIIDKFSKLLANNDPSVFYGLRPFNIAKTRLILYSNKLTEEQKLVMKDYNGEKIEVKGNHIVDSLRICGFYHY